MSEKIYVHGSTINPLHPLFSLYKTIHILFDLAWDLIRFLKCPGMWILNFLRLTLFVLICLPGFLPTFLNYLRNKNFKKNIVYGERFRNQLDVYHPGSKSKSKKLPVCVFVTGGAWIIGYKAWGWLMGKAFAENGCICIIPDYRNFPQTDIEGMVDDVTLALNWISKNMKEINGDPDNVTLIGQSAGAHITSLLLLKRKINLKIKRWIGISGVYNPKECFELWYRRGLPTTLIENIFVDFDKASPSIAAQKIVEDSINFPQTILIHGSDDCTAPVSQTIEFSKILQEQNVQTNLMVWTGKSHTDLILEDAIAGHDPLMTYLLRLLHHDETFEPYLPVLMQNKFVNIARWVNPF